MSAWRQAGLNYINYSNIAAKLLRQALKPEPKAEALKRGDAHIRITKWADGKPIKQHIFAYDRKTLFINSTIKKQIFKGKYVKCKYIK
ncbi:hypothetical protein NQ315_013399 [Exocentrus adspersus]|uniref:Uncharacterized protein n=1 Tax=Exocentrus adspersus TaxID=1586481 RepID=A0AAV8VSB5_9CUCU|nr:hypothetical protein NQ315_013399 [Exocentrus adspersus]